VTLDERPLVFALSPSELEAAAPPETGLFGLTRPAERPLRLGSAAVSWFVPHERWARRERPPPTDPLDAPIVYQRVYAVVERGDTPVLFSVEYPGGPLPLVPGADVAALLCPEWRDSRTRARHVLVLPVDERDTVESVLLRVARVDPDRQPRGRETARGRCGFSRVVLSRERAYLESLIR